MVVVLIIICSVAVSAGIQTKIRGPQIQIGKRQSLFQRGVLSIVLWLLPNKSTLPPPIIKPDPSI